MIKSVWWVVLLLVLLVLPVGGVAGADDEEALAVIAKPKKAPRVPWITDLNWEEIKDLAHDRDQPILIDFTATWCGPCKLLDVMVFTEKPVIKMLSNVVTFQADIDDPRHQDLKKALNIEVVPTIVWLNKRGEEIDRFRSYVSSVQFIDIVEGWQNNNTIDRVLSQRQLASPQDPAVLLDVARRQAERGNDRQAEVLYRRIMNLRHEADPRVVARGMLGLAQAEYELGQEESARHLARQVAQMYTRPDVSDDIAQYRAEGMVEVALFQEKIDDTMGMLATYRSLAETNRTDVLALHGFARAAIKAGVELKAATRSAIRAVVFSDNDPDVISTLAECYYWRGMYGKAVKWQKKAVGEAPHTKIYQERLALYEQAKSGDPHGMRGAPEGKS